VKCAIMVLRIVDTYSFIYLFTEVTPQGFVVAANKNDNNNPLGYSN
jgi:hypothetical protein